MKGRFVVLLSILLMASIALMLNACDRSPISNIQSPISIIQSPTPFQPATWTPFPPTPAPPTSTPTKTPPPFSIWVDPSLPEAFRDSLLLPEGLPQVEEKEGATFRLEVGDDSHVSRWTYALVAPFPTIPDGIDARDLRRVWRGENSGPITKYPLLMDESTREIFSTLWGEPAVNAVRALSTNSILDHAWDHRPSWAIIPFENLDPRWKVLEVDGSSPIHKDFAPEDYVLSLPITLHGNETFKAIFGPESVVTSFPSTNRDARKMTTLVMTGVTALVRATAWTMEIQGITYPARDIREWLREADLTHISNEVPFAEDCPYPDPVQEDMIFCSDPAYIALLEDVGTDLIELTGDHFGDWGREAILYTLDLYDARGWLYYGGGENYNQGRKAQPIEHNGNRFAFIGCNAKGGGYAGASATNPGAVACDFPWLHAEISRLQGAGYLPIVTFQHFEYYTYAALPNQQADSRGMINAGAVIVSGSQAHQPQAFEFFDGRLIHYGLGNLFFDQLDISEETRQAFIDRHVFYDGRHISTELLTILFVDYARARPMNSGEREALLKAVFSASGW